MPLCCAGLSLGLLLCPEPAGSQSELIPVGLEATSGARPRVNAVRTHVFGSSLLPLIQGIQKMQVGLGAEGTW